MTIEGVLELKTLEVRYTPSVLCRGYCFKSLSESPGLLKSIKDPEWEISNRSVVGRPRASKGTPLQILEIVKIRPTGPTTSRRWKGVRN